MYKDDMKNSKIRQNINYMEWEYESVLWIATIPGVFHERSKCPIFKWTDSTSGIGKTFEREYGIKNSKQIIHVCQRGKWRTGSEQISDCQCYHTIFLCIPPYCLWVLWNCRSGLLWGLCWLWDTFSWFWIWWIHISLYQRADKRRYRLSGV